jgi:hypothetical protein
MDILDLRHFSLDATDSGVVFGPMHGRPARGASVAARAWYLLFFVSFWVILGHPPRAGRPSAKLRAARLHPPHSAGPPRSEAPGTELEDNEHLSDLLFH